MLPSSSSSGKPSDRKKRFNQGKKPSELLEDLNRLEDRIESLKKQYEQYFLGILKFSPERLHYDVKALFRELQKAPFKTASITYRLKSVEQKYQAHNAYWVRTLREKENGTYFRDVFKAKLKEQAEAENARSKTREGQVDNQLEALFHSYKNTLEKESGQKQNLSFDSFKGSLLARAKDFKEKNPGKKLAFSVVVKDGKVSVRAETK